MINRRIAIGYIDLLFLLLIVLLRLTHNPEIDTTSTTQPGNMIVEISWKEGPIDVDLWVAGPDRVAVGYSRQSSALFNLLRDDLGTANDRLTTNYEMTFSKGLAAGEYIINAHLYNLQSPAEYPVEVVARVVVKLEGGKSITVWEGSGVLEHARQELTLVRFSLNKAGSVVIGSIHNLPYSLRIERG